MPRYHYIYEEKGVFLGNALKTGEMEAAKAIDLRNHLAKYAKYEAVTICDCRTKKPLCICPKCHAEYRWIKGPICAKCGERFRPNRARILRLLLCPCFFVLALISFTAFSPWIAGIPLLGMVLCFLPYGKNKGAATKKVPAHELYEGPGALADIQAPARYSVSADGVITDSTSALQWVVGPDLRTTYGGAEEWVQKCGIAGGGWRMPTREELRRLRVQKEGCGNMDPVFKTTGCNIWAEPQGAGGGYGPRAWFLRFANGSEALVATDYFDEGTRAFAVRPLRQTQTTETHTPIQANEITTVVPDLLLFVAEQWKGEKDPSLRLRREDYRQIFEAMVRLPIQSNHALPPKAYENEAIPAVKLVANMGFYLAQAIAQGATLRIEAVERGLLRVRARSTDWRIERNGNNEFRAWWSDDSETTA